MKAIINSLVVTIKISHLAILFFVVFGWLISNPKLLTIHLVFLPIMILQWQLNQGTCILTNLENYFRGEVSEKNEQQGQFIKAILGRCFNPLPTDATLKKVVYGIIFLSWLLSASHLWLLKSYFNYYAL